MFVRKYLSDKIPKYPIDCCRPLRPAAQYGSDAIAGVMNLELKKEKRLSAQVSYEGHLTPKANDHRGDFDGRQGQLDINLSIRGLTGLVFYGR